MSSVLECTRAPQMAPERRGTRCCTKLRSCPVWNCIVAAITNWRQKAWQRAFCGQARGSLLHSVASASCPDTPQAAFPLLLRWSKRSNRHRPSAHQGLCLGRLYEMRHCQLHVSHAPCVRSKKGAMQTRVSPSNYCLCIVIEEISSLTEVPSRYHECLYKLWAVSTTLA